MMIMIMEMMMMKMTMKMIMDDDFDEEDEVHSAATMLVFLSAEKKLNVTILSDDSSERSTYTTQHITGTQGWLG
jgi:hypothetical protein